MSYKVACPHMPRMSDKKLGEAFAKEFGTLQVNEIESRDRREKILLAMLTRSTFRLNKIVAGLEFAAGYSIDKNGELDEVSEMLSDILTGDFHVASL